MLLRWLLNNYLREAAQGKVRDVVGDLVRGQQPSTTPRQTRIPPASAEPRTLNPEPSAVPDELLPCDAAFIFALGIESGGVVDRMADRETSRQPHGVEHAGKLAGREVVIVESGVGAKAAARATSEAIQFYQPKWVISAGFAGGLDEKIRRGHILLADEVTDGSGPPLAVGLKLDSQALAATRGLHVGRLLTVKDLVRKPDERRELARQHQAIAVDMETFAVAQACQQRGVRLLVAKAITDAVDDELPPELEHLLAQKSLAGKLGAAAGAVFRRWGAAKDLWQLREDALKASDRLARFLVSLLDQLPQTDQ